MNTHVKALNISLGNQVHQYTERLYSTIMPVSSQGYKDVSTHAKLANTTYKYNQGGKSHRIILTDTEKASKKIQHTFMIKVPKKPTRIIPQNNKVCV